MDNIRILISRYLDGELSDAEIGQLASVLETDVASVDQLVFNSFIHAQLLNWMDQQGEHTRDGASVFDGNELLGTVGLSGMPPSLDDGDKVSIDRTQHLFAQARRRLS